MNVPHDSADWAAEEAAGGFGLTKSFQVHWPVDALKRPKDGDVFSHLVNFAQDRDSHARRAIRQRELPRNAHYLHLCIPAVYVAR